MAETLPTLKKLERRKQDMVLTVPLDSLLRKSRLFAGSALRDEPALCELRSRSTSA